MVLSCEEWPSWLSEQCGGRGWTHGQDSPIVWRELVDSGGKGLYLGGLDAFEEHAIKYYNITPNTDMELESKIGDENLQTFKQNQLEKQRLVVDEPVKICVTDCNNHLAYHLAQLLSTGGLGPHQKVAIHLYHSPSSSACDGVVMELQDLASPLLEYVKCTSSLQEAFDGVHLAYILDYPVHSLDDRLQQQVQAATLFHKYANTLSLAASKDVKVVITGRFANTAAGLMALSVTSLSPSCFVAAPCLAERQARAVLASRLKLNSSNIKQVVVWGNTHGPVTDTTFTRVRGYPGAIVGPDPFDLPLTKCEFDREWLAKVFPKLMMERYNLKGYREGGPVLAEAVGLAKLGQHWLLVENTMEWVSVGIVSDGNMHDIPKGVACCVPCQCVAGKWQPVPNLDPPKFIKVRTSQNLPKIIIVIIF